MSHFSKESLSELRSRIDLIEVLSPYVQFQKSGTSYKALCPFHDERTPSFVIQKGAHHYHCFGCGAHGDAIQFLILHLKMGFVEAVETLAERFGVLLAEESQTTDPTAPSKAVLKEVLEQTCRFYQFCLLHTADGHAALLYLYKRGIDLNFIRQFRIGYAPPHILPINDPLVLKTAGLMTAQGHPFFSDRITIPILDPMGSVIGFSARTRSSEGPKYINTPETPLFKKSRVLFGLSYSRKKIAKERKALIVEGQIDALRLIHVGYDWTVAGQGTAFTEEHVKALIHLGIRVVYLALDGDGAGQEAAVKIGHLFQKEGVEVFVVPLDPLLDPDLVIREQGPEEWEKRLAASLEYLPFLVQYLSRRISIHTPAGKNELVQVIAHKIREWNHPLMIHESLRKLAQLTQVPESLLLTEQKGIERISPSPPVHPSFDPDRILETDLCRWLLLGKDPARLLCIAQHNLTPDHFYHPCTRTLYAIFTSGQSYDLLSLAMDLKTPEEQAFFSEILQKKINLDRVEGFTETVQRLLDRHWMKKREEIKLALYSGTLSEEKVLELARHFDALKKTRPHVVIP
jgi:DNA primase